ncbi:hypothetical protein [Serratia liquefaciens]|uniref:hypothetical protein n=1 Tax=Serratia liquefaciens TaxID=614 RepID=UPI0021CA2122|nr:hypothetical protein [Serratia liquefaciens]
MTKNAQSILDPIDSATAQAAIESFADLKTHEELLKFSAGITFALKFINMSLAVQSFDSDELDAVNLALIAVKDIATAKAVAVAFHGKEE